MAIQTQILTGFKKETVRHLFWDNDALNTVYSDKDKTILEEILKLFPNANWWLTAATCTEFYNSGKGVGPLYSKRTFLKECDYAFKQPEFSKADYDKVNANILALKKIHVGLCLNTQPDFPDLLLQGILYALSPTAAVITKNINDFSTKLFQIMYDIEVDDTVKIENGGQRNSIYILTERPEEFETLLLQFEEKTKSFIETQSQIEA